MKRLFKNIHLWLSIPFGLVITITCFTGAMLVFEKEITNICIANITNVTPTGEPLPIDSLAKRAQSALKKDVIITGFTISHNPKEAYKVNISKPRHAGIYINQYTGEIKGEHKRLPFFNIMFRMHRWLMDSSPKNNGIFWGKMIVGASTLAFVAILLSGLVIWWPRNRKLLSNRLKVVTKKGWKRFWYDLHVTCGFYAMLLLLAMALTGLTWSYEWYRNGFYTIFGADNVRKENIKKQHEKEKYTANVSPYKYWQKALEEVASIDSEYKQITISKGNITIQKEHFGNQRGNDKYTFDNTTGEIIKSIPYKESDKRNKIRGWIYSIHVGSWGGIITKILTFIAAMLGATLPLTGYYLWIKRIK